MRNGSDAADRTEGTKGEIMVEVGQDWIVIPGERVGRITAGSSGEDIRRDYGEDSLLLDADLATGAGLIPFGDPASMLDLTWRDRAKQIGIVEVQAAYGRFRWRTRSGFEHGLSVDDAERIAGTLTIDSGGRVTSAENSSELGVTLFVTFKPTGGGASSLPNAILTRYGQGPSWKSSDMSMAPLNKLLSLTEMRIRLTE
jgi:hypothetical protein